MIGGKMIQPIKFKGVALQKGGRGFSKVAKGRYMGGKGGSEILKKSVM